jgi:16S rRNA (cytosine967-C5)-methyltransferase
MFGKIQIMQLPFRDYHIISILEKYELQQSPLDVFLSGYFRFNKAIGSKDRSFICETIYTLIRYKALIDHFCIKPISWQKRLDVFKNFNFEKHLRDISIPLNVRLNFPKDYLEKVSNSLKEKTEEFCFLCNEKAPITIRVNLLKTTQETLLKTFENYNATACKFSKTGIVFPKRINFFSLEEFKQGLFEVQDEGSQLISDLVSPTPGSRVLDFCCGSGGKTLSFAHLLQSKGQIFLHDVRASALFQAKKRLKRAGIQNAQIKTSEELKKLNLKMDFVLLDVPCSGSGTLRRNPDMKWKFSNEVFSNLLNEQRQIFKDAFFYLKKDGFLIYTTCSVLKEENEDQIEFFIKNYNLELVEKRSWLPQKNGMDGFFGAVLKLKN